MKALSTDCEHREVAHENNYRLSKYLWNSPNKCSGTRHMFCVDNIAITRTWTERKEGMLAVITLEYTALCFLHPMLKRDRILRM